MSPPFCTLLCRLRCPAPCIVVVNAQLPGDPTVFHRSLFTVVHEEILSYASAHLQLVRELKPSGKSSAGPGPAAAAAVPKTTPSAKSGYVRVRESYSEPALTSIRLHLIAEHHAVVVVGFFCSCCCVGVGC
jgi:hypothetical protein